MGIFRKKKEKVERTPEEKVVRGLTCIVVLVAMFIVAKFLDNNSQNLEEQMDNTERLMDEQLDSLIRDVIKKENYNTGTTNYTLVGKKEMEFLNFIPKSIYEDSLSACQMTMRFQAKANTKNAKTLYEKARKNETRYQKLVDEYYDDSTNVVRIKCRRITFKTMNEDSITCYQNLKENTKQSYISNVINLTSDEYDWKQIEKEFNSLIK